MCRYCKTVEAPPHRAYCCSEHRLKHYAETGRVLERSKGIFKPSQPPPPEERNRRTMGAEEVIKALKGTPLWNS